MSARCSRWFAPAMLVAALSAGCGPPPDETLLHFLGFQGTNASGDTSTTSAVSLIKGRLDGATESVGAAFENVSIAVGNAAGTGILVKRAHVEYSLQGAPSYDFPVTLYLAAPAKAGETTRGTLANFPIVPASLEQWIMASVSQEQASFGAHVTFYAETDGGTELETGGGISVELH